MVEVLKNNLLTRDLTWCYSRFQRAYERAPSIYLPARPKTKAYHRPPPDKVKRPSSGVQIVIAFCGTAGSKQYMH